MTVHNAEPYLDAAVESILRQSHANFEFLIRDDGSSDTSLETLIRWADTDRRIKIFPSSENLGPAGSSNWIARQASHGLVARMDADDISHPDRLSRQVSAMLARPDIDLLGTLFKTIDATGRVVRGRDRSRIVRRSAAAPFAHGSIMYRRNAFERVGGYRSECDYWEDQDLFLRISTGGEVGVLPEALYMHRHAPTSTRLRSGRGRVERSIDLGQRCRSQYLQSGDYEDILRLGKADLVQPRAILAVAALEVAAKERSAALDRLLRHARLEVSTTTLIAFVWAVWATLSPGSLRLAGSLVTAVRDNLAGRKIKDGSIYKWNNVIDKEAGTK